jgi:hypothetical protein
MQFKLGLRVGEEVKRDSVTRKRRALAIQSVHFGFSVTGSVTRLGSRLVA